MKPAHPATGDRVFPGLGKKYLEEYRKSIEESEDYYSLIASRLLYWKKPWTRYTETDPPLQKFFTGGYTNWTYLLDLNNKTWRRNKVLYYWEDEAGNKATISYNEFFRKVNQISTALKRLGLKKGDRVAVYMPTVPEAAALVVAVNRIGGIFTPISPGLAVNALAQRIKDSHARFIFTADAAVRRGKRIPLKKIVDKTLENIESVEKVIVMKRLDGSDTELREDRDVWLHRLLEETGEDAYVEPEWMEANEPITILYTSGTSGRPKGIVHSHVSAIIGVYSLLRLIMGFPDEGADEDVMLNISELGWSTGIVAHVIGPHIFNYTAVLYDGAPNHPRPDQYLALIERYKATIFWGVPTLFRMYRMIGEQVERHDTSSLRLIVSIGEHFPADLWTWVYKAIGRERIPVINIYGSTESLAMAAIPTRIEQLPIKPGSPGVPMPGFELEVVDEDGKPVASGEIGALAIKAPFKAPYVFLTVWGDPQGFGKPGWKGDVDRLIQSYYAIPGYYTTGDAAVVDEDGYIWIVGRIDDTLKISGHRITSAEIEDGLSRHPSVAEAMVVGKPDPVKGEVAAAFIVLKPGYTPSEKLAGEIRETVKREVGPIAVVGQIYFTTRLPRNRNGKLVRRVGRALVRNTDPGDLTVLEDPSVVEELKKALENPY